MILRKAKVRYELNGYQQKVDHLFMDELKLYSKGKSPVSSCIDMGCIDVYILYSHQNAIWIEKCGVLVLNRDKIKCMDGLVMPQERLWSK